MDVSPFAVVLLAALLSLLFFATRNWKPSDVRRRLPPSPWGLPLLGHLPLLGPLPHRKLQAMAASHGPVMLLRLGRVPTVVASSAAAAQEVMKTRDLAFASRPRVRMAERLVYGRDMAFVPYGEHWRQARRVCVLHLLSHRRVQSFRHAREQEAAAMVDRVRRSASSGAVVNVTALIISYTNGIISRAAFGDDRSFGHHDGGEELTELFADFEGLLGTVTIGDFVPWLAWVDTLMGLDARAARTSARMDALLERVIAEHRQKRRDGRWEDDGRHRDFVDVMLDVNEEAEKNAGGAEVMFDNVTIKAIILDMFGAATDTTFTALVWAMAELINHPREMRKVQDEIRAAVGGGDSVTEDHLPKLRYLRCVIKETFRLRTPLPLLLPRETMEDTELLGYHVPARTRVVVNAWAIARDPAAWERPEEFIPERFAGDDLTADYLLGQDFRFVPFGAGRRGCPGIGFAVPSLELALASLLYQFDWELPAGGPSKLEMDELNGLSVRLKWIDGPEMVDPRILLFRQKAKKPYDKYKRWVSPPPNPPPMTDEEKKIAIATRMANPPLCYCGVPAHIHRMMPGAPYTPEFECRNTTKGGYPLCDFKEYDYGPKSYWPESKEKKGKEVEVELIPPDRNCRCGIAGNYGLVPSELGIGYYCGHMSGDDMGMRRCDWEHYLDKHVVENEILLRRINGNHPNVLRSYLRCRKEATRELARQMGYWPRRERTSGKLKRE